MADAGHEPAGGAPGDVVKSPPAGAGAGSPGRAETLVQYIVLREDLRAALAWPTGSLVAQGAHAATAVLWSHRDDELVRRYMGDLDHMHKIVLAAKNEAQLRKVAGSLQDAGIAHKLWVRAADAVGAAPPNAPLRQVEQPENFATCIATKPYPRAAFGKLLRKLKLFK